MVLYGKVLLEIICLYEAEGSEISEELKALSFSKGD
jgi:hypothetical protein